MGGLLHLMSTNLVFFAFAWFLASTVNAEVFKSSYYFDSEETPDFLPMLAQQERGRDFIQLSSAYIEITSLIVDGAVVDGKEVNFITEHPPEWITTETTEWHCFSLTAKIMPNVYYVDPQIIGSRVMSWQIREDWSTIIVEYRTRDRANRTIGLYVATYNRL